MITLLLVKKYSARRQYGSRHLFFKQHMVHERERERLRADCASWLHGFTWCMTMHEVKVSEAAVRCGTPYIDDPNHPTHILHAHAPEIENINIGSVDVVAHLQQPKRDHLLSPEHLESRSLTRDIFA